jgi:hypothetical protein
MAFIVADRVKETTNSTGTGTYALGGAAAGFQAFSAVTSNTDTVYYAISDNVYWEVGVGTYASSGNSITRTTILSSSNSNSAVNWGVGTKDIFLTYPAGKAVVEDLSNNVTIGNNLVVGGTVDGVDIAARDAVLTSTTNTATAALPKAGGTMSGNLILNADPTIALQSATKQYVDTIAAAGIHYHQPCRAETTANLNATYSNGSSGVGATLTNAGTQAAIVVDGVTLSATNRVMVQLQTNQAHNGVYTVTTVGSASTNWVLTRATDADSYAPSDSDALGQGDAFFITEGTVHGGELDVMTTSGVITFGTTNIVFALVSDAPIYTAGTGMSLSGTEFSIGQAVATNSNVSFNQVTGALVGNASTATALATGRTISLTGDATGSSGSFNGTGNASISTTVAGLVGKQPYLTIAVTVSNPGAGNRYYLDGALQQTALLQRSVTVRFDQSDSSNSSHPLLLSTTSNGTHGGGSSYNTGVTVVGTPGSSGAYTQVTLEQDAPINLFYYCTNHSGMGGKVSTGIDLTTTATPTFATVTADLTGSATTLATGRTIGMTGDVVWTSASFDGSGNVTGTATIQANSVALGTDTTGNYVQSVANGSYLTGGGSASEGTALTLGVDATNANTASKVVARDGSGNFSAGTVTAALSGNASTATTLATARTIGGVSFNGSANINLPGVNTSGNQATSGNAGSATVLQTARTINGVSFNGSANITVADSTKLPLGGGAMTGAITTNSTFDGRNVSVDGSKLDTIATSANNYSFPYTVSQGESVSTVVQRNSGGYIFSSYFNGSGTFATSGASSGMGNFTGNNGSDTYGRSYNAAAARTLLNVANGATNVTNNNQLTNGAGYITSYVNTTYSAGSGLDLSGTTFSIESDLRGEVFYIGRDNNDYIGVETNTINFVLDGSTDMRLENDGDLHVEGNVIAYSTTISDERLKTDIVKIDGALDKVAQLNGYTFTYTADGKKSAGVIAQEVQKVLPSAIVESKLPLKMGDDDETEYMTVQYDQLMGLMVEAIKELKAEVAELKGK